MVCGSDFPSKGKEGVGRNEFPHSPWSTFRGQERQDALTQTGGEAG